MSSSQSDHSSEKSKPKKAKAKKVIPLLGQVKKIKPKHKSIVINLSMTRYEVIADVADELDWHVQYGTKNGDWDVLWIDQMIEPQILIKMHFFQKISHFPGIYVLARKNLLGLSFMQMQKKFPQAYSFIPQTWMLPQDFSAFRQQIQKSQKLGQSRKCFIVKPEADCQGRGIFLTFDLDSVQNGKHFVVQQYIERPFLIQGLKFDFRVYMLLCGTNPMRLYVYEEGLARFATEKYCEPNKNNLKKMFMHLTNYAINKKNPKYVYNSSINNMASGHKRSLTSALVYIKRKGLNVEVMKQKIDDVIIKTTLMGMPLVNHQYKFCQPDDDYRNMCFHILGIDIMINQQLNPIVLQVNHTPSFATDTPLDYHIKSNLIRDTLNLLNINEKSKKQLLKKTNSYQRERVINAKRLIQTQQQKQKIKQCQKKRDMYEKDHLGRYRKVYPVQDQQKMKEYEEYYSYAQKIYFAQNNWIRSEIQAEKEKDKKKQEEKTPKLSVDRKPKSCEVPFFSRNQPKLMHHSSFTDHTYTDQQRETKNPREFREQIREKLRQKISSVSCTQIETNRPLNLMTENTPTTVSNSLRNKRSQIVKNLSECKPQKVKIIDNSINERISLPKIQQMSPTKSYMPHVRKGKFQSLKKRMLGIKQFSQFSSGTKGWMDEYSGKFITPKVVNFESYASFD